MKDRDTEMSQQQINQQFFSENFQFVAQETLVDERTSKGALCKSLINQFLYYIYNIIKKNNFVIFRGLGELGKDEQGKFLI